MPFEFDSPNTTLQPTTTISDNVDGTSQAQGSSQQSDILDSDMALLEQIVDNMAEEMNNSLVTENTVEGGKEADSEVIEDIVTTEAPATEVMPGDIVQEIGAVSNEMTSESITDDVTESILDSQDVYITSPSPANSDSATTSDSITISDYDTTSGDKLKPTKPEDINMVDEVNGGLDNTIPEGAVIDEVPSQILQNEEKTVTEKSSNNDQTTSTNNGDSSIQGSSQHDTTESNISNFGLPDISSTPNG